MRKLGAAIRLCAFAGAAVLVLSGCSGIPDFINSTTKFSESKFGKASPRVTTSRNVPKGGGREMVGKPYQVAGTWYHPKADPNYDETGAASWYGPNFHGRQTANGEIFDQFALSAAHPTLPLPSYVRVTNLENNRSVMVRVNDRGPFVHGREIDLSSQAAEMLGYRNKGIARVRVKYVGPAPLEGDDTRMLMATYNAPSEMERNRNSGDNQIRVASATPAPTRQLAPVNHNMLIAAQAPAPQSNPRGNIVQTAEGFNMVLSSASVSDGLGPLFYAAPGETPGSDALIDSAFAATEAMANGPAALRQWQQGVDADARDVSVGLGVFADPRNAQNVIQAFALIGAVDETIVGKPGEEAVQLTLSQLKPGATRNDISVIAARLGLSVQYLYD